MHKRVLMLDTHIDIPLDFAISSVHPGQRGNAQIDLPKTRSGSGNARFWIVHVGQIEHTAENYVQAKQLAHIKFKAIHRMARMYPERVEFARRMEGVWRMYASGKL